MMALNQQLKEILEILPLYSQYIFSLLIFVTKNKHLFPTNYQIEPFTARVYMVVNRKSGLVANGRELYTATHIRSTLFIDDLLPIRQWGRKRRSLCLHNF